jgi:hypothetical protein
MDEVDRLLPQSEQQVNLKDELWDAQLHRAEHGGLGLGLGQALLTDLEQDVAALAVGDQLCFGEQIASVDVVRVVMGIDYIPDPARATPQSEFPDLLGLLWKGQGVYDNGAIGCGHDNGRHLGVQRANKHKDIFSNTFP